MRGSYYNSLPVRTGEDHRDVAGLRWIKREQSGIWATSVEADDFARLSAEQPSLSAKFKPVEVSGKSLYYAALSLDEFEALAA